MGWEPLTYGLVKALISEPTNQPTNQPVKLGSYPHSRVQKTPESEPQIPKSPKSDVDRHFSFLEV